MPEDTDDPKGWRPVPDPTVLTTEALLREINNLRLLLSSRMDAMDQATALRLDATTHLQSDGRRRVEHLHELITEKFAGVQTQFTERDVRTESEKRAAKEALDAALLAAKELVGVTNENTTKQVGEVKSLITTQNSATEQRITELKERIDRGQSGFEGAATQRTETRGGNQLVIAGAAAFIGFLGLIVAGVALFAAFSKP